MRAILFALAILSSAAVKAVPVTYTFSGQITQYNFWRSFSDPVPSDPTVPLYGTDSTLIFNGDASVFGQFTIDVDNLPIPGHVNQQFPLTYQVATEGSIFYMAPPSFGSGVFDSLTANQNQIAWHIEGPSLSEDGPMHSDIESFEFNFSGGVFTGGSFILTYMMGHGLNGGLTGTISTLNEVPLPSAMSLMLTAISSLLIFKRRAHGN